MRKTALKTRVKKINVIATDQIFTIGYSTRTIDAFILTTGAALTLIATF